MGSSTSPGTPEVYELISDVFPLEAIVPLAVCCESIFSALICTWINILISEHNIKCESAAHSRYSDYQVQEIFGMQLMVLFHNIFLLYICIPDSGISEDLCHPSHYNRNTL